MAAGRQQRSKGGRPSVRRRCEHVFVHGAEVRQAASRLIQAGVSDREIAERLGVPRRTVSGWRRATPGPAAVTVCPRCWRRSRPLSVTPSDYAELLGFYLGDGHINATARTSKLRISLDSKYPQIVGAVRRLLSRCFPANAVHVQLADGGATSVVAVHHNHLPCLFPQHGPGKKHERRLAFEPWQVLLIGQAPFSFLRGAIHSDGSVFVNRTGRYAYLSYHFGNLSGEILDLVEATGRSVGLRPRRSGKHLRFNRREDVARLLEHVPAKS